MAGEPMPAAISVGTNPTFDGERDRRVEAYVLDRTDLELYDEPVEISFVARIRGMVKFEGVDALIETMAQDVARTRELLGDVMTHASAGSGTRVSRPTSGSSTTGCPWFVPERREVAHRALHSSRTVAGLALIAVAALALGVVLAYVTDELSLAPATMVTLTALAALAYAGPRLGAWPIAKWASRRTMRSLRLLFPMITRALPLLLLFMTFLFINAEVWQVSSTLDGAVLWVTVLLFSAIALGFLLVRLPEELDHVDNEVEVSSVLHVCEGTPLETYARGLTDGDGPEHRLIEQTQVHGFEKANLLLVLIVTQALQVLLLALSVFAFFVIFGVGGHDPRRTRGLDRLGHPRASVGHQPLGRAAAGLGVPRGVLRACTSPSTRSPTRPTATSSSPRSRPSSTARSASGRSTWPRGVKPPLVAAPGSTQGLGDAQLALHHLAGVVARKVVQDHHLARHLVTGQVLLHVPLEVVRCRGGTRLQDDVGVEALAELLVVDADHRRLHDVLVLVQRLLDLEGKHVLST